MNKLIWMLCLSLMFLACPAHAADPVILFDQGHGQQFVVENGRSLDLSGLASLFMDAGGLVKTSRQPLSTASLLGVDVLIISGPFAPISPEEIEVVTAFVEKGGKLAVMAHIAQPIAPLLQRLNVSISSVAIAEQERIIGTNARDFMVTDLSEHPLTKGLDMFAVYGSWALLDRGEANQTVARTSSRAWADLNQNGILNDKDAQQAFSLIITGRLGQGHFAVFADDAIFQNQFLRGGNKVLGENLARWFCLQQEAI